MEQVKLTSWNIEHSDKLIDALNSNDATTKRHAEARRDAIRDEIKELASDILLICEGPNGEARAKPFFEDVAPGYRLVVRDSPERSDYGMQGTDATTGRQWIWFLVRDGTPIEGALLHLDQWRKITEKNSGGEHSGGHWDVSYPQLVKEEIQFKIEGDHSHWRHPQVLQAKIDGEFVEIIGAHLKSKITQVRIEGSPEDDDFFSDNRELVADIIKSRVKLSTECVDIRHYIDFRFREDAGAAIMVAGDLNDGPGKERIERRFLYHDLIEGLQGEIFFAQKFLNHALFDAKADERWSVFFKDKLDPNRDPRMLLDHILFSQAFTGNPQVKHSAFRARKEGGMVEHQVHHTVTGARPKFAMTSDHKPVSMTFERRTTTS